MSEVLYQTFLKNMQTRRYAPSTIRHYNNYLRNFENYIGIPLEEAQIPHVQQFLYHLSVELKRCGEVVNMARASIKFFFETVLLRNWNPNAFPRVKRSHPIPKVLTRQEVQKLLNATDNLKHKTILLVAYSAGLRISEVRMLKVTDIRSDINKINIEYGKGNRQRFAWLSEKALLCLREYYRKYRPPKDGYLFPGASKEPLTDRSLQRFFKSSLQKSGITSDVTFHSLRHSFATHLIETNTPILYVKEMLGHRRAETTERYIHLANSEKLQYKNPADELEGI
jgi:site-specific recombinase XerD